LELSAQGKDCLDTQNHLLKAASNYLSKGNKAKTAESEENVTFVGDSIKLSEEDRVVVRKRLHNLQQTFSTLSHYTSIFSVLLESDSVSVNTTHYGKKYPFDTNALRSMMGGVFQQETIDRNLMMKKAYKALAAADLPGPIVKRSKKNYMDGAAIIDKFISPTPGQKEILKNILGNELVESEDDEEEETKDAAH
jgi:hypothetical protein